VPDNIIITPGSYLWKYTKDGTITSLEEMICPELIKESREMLLKIIGNKNEKN